MGTDSWPEGMPAVWLGSNEGPRHGHVAPHAHDYYEILYLLEGSRQLVLDGRSHRGTSGDLMIYRPHEVHEEHTDSERVSLLALRFPQWALAQTGIAFPDIDALGPVLRVPEGLGLSALLHRMLSEFRQPGRLSERLLGAWLAEFLILLHRIVDRAVAADGLDVRERLRRLIAHLREHPPVSIDIDALADDIGANPSHLTRLFREETGTPPKRFLIALRIQRAKDLLLGTDYPAQEIADMLGYESPFFFYRQFKQHTGMTCSAFRQGTGKASPHW